MMHDDDYTGHALPRGCHHTNLLLSIQAET